jgi:hypothetical protein
MEMEQRLEMDHPNLRLPYSKLSSGKWPIEFDDFLFKQMMISIAMLVYQRLTMNHGDEFCASRCVHW